MADVHYEVDETLKHGRDFMDAQRALAAAWDKITRLHGVLIQEQTGDSSLDASYAQVAAQFGYADSATAHASFLEVDTCFSAANAAITQMLNQHL